MTTANSVLHLLFPVPLRQSYFPHLFNEEETQFFHEQGLVRVKNNNNQLNKNYYVLHEPPMARIRSFIEEELKEYLRETHNPPEDEVEYYITQSWINYTKTGERHHRHAHPNSLVSGVFYIAADFNYDSLTVFREDGYQRIHVQANPTEHFEPSKTFPVMTGMLMIFPSNLIHEVRQAGGVEERVSLAFNTFVRGTLMPKGQLLSELKLS